MTRAPGGEVASAEAPPTPEEAELQAKLGAVLDLLDDGPRSTRWRTAALVAAGLAVASVWPMWGTDRSFFELAPAIAMLVGVLAVLVAGAALAPRFATRYLMGLGIALLATPLLAGPRVLVDTAATLAMVAGAVLVGVATRRAGAERARLGRGTVSVLRDLLAAGPPGDAKAGDDAVPDASEDGAAALDRRRVATLDAALAAHLAPQRPSAIDRYEPWLWGAALLAGASLHTAWWRDPTSVGSWAGRLVVPGTQLVGLGVAALVLFGSLAIVTRSLGWKRLSALLLLMGVTAVAVDTVLTVVFVLPLVPPGPAPLLVVGVAATATALTFGATSRRGVVVALVIGLLFGGIRPAFELASSGSAPWERVLRATGSSQVPGTASARSIDGVAVRPDGTVVVAAGYALFTLDRDRLRFLRSLPPDTSGPRAILAASSEVIVVRDARGEVTVLGADGGDRVRLTAPGRYVALVDVAAEREPALVVRRDDETYVTSSVNWEVSNRDGSIGDAEPALDLPDGRPVAFDGRGVIVAAEDGLVLVTAGTVEALPDELLGCGPVEQFGPDSVVVRDGEVWTIDEDRRVRRLRDGTVEVAPVVVIERDEVVVDLAIHPDDGPLVRTSRGLSRLRDAGDFTPETCEGSGP